jgi:16S rRNA processing protein RimM
MLSDDLARFRRGSVLHLEGSEEQLTVSWSQQDGPGVIMRFAEVPDRPAAEALRDRYLEVSTLRELPAGTYWWHEVTGAQVVTADGEVLGTVADVFRAGEGEVFAVRGGPRGEVLVPAVAGIVTELAPRDGRIVVDRDALGLDEEPARPRPRGRRTTRALRAATGPSEQEASSGDTSPGEDGGSEGGAPPDGHEPRAGDAG